MQNLENAFSEYGLTAKVLTATPSQVSRNPDVFFLNIGRKSKGNVRLEWFDIWRGHGDNVVQILSGDKNIKQVVLMCNEPQRAAREDITPNKKTLAKILASEEEFRRWKDNSFGGGNIFLENGRIIRQWMTPKGVRYYLMGLDERQLFIAQLPKAATTVAEAHRILKPGRVMFAEGSANTSRQGEWFFVEISHDENDRLTDLIRQGKLIVKRKEALSRGGHPHVADELIRVVGEAARIRGENPHGWPVRQRDEMFVRGAVRHQDHKTVSFKYWRRVILNMEREIGTGARSGWVD